MNSFQDFLGIWTHFKTSWAYELISRLLRHMNSFQDFLGIWTHFKTSWAYELISRLLGHMNSFQDFLTYYFISITMNWTLHCEWILIEIELTASRLYHRLQKVFHPLLVWTGVCYQTDQFVDLDPWADHKWHQACQWCCSFHSIYRIPSCLNWNPAEILHRQSREQNCRTCWASVAVFLDTWHSSEIIENILL